MKTRRSGQDLMLLFKSPKFLKKLKEVRRRLKIPLNGFPTLDELWVWEKTVAKTLDWNDSLSKCTIEIHDGFKLDTEYTSALKRYVLEGKIVLEDLEGPKAKIVMEQFGDFIDGQWEPVIQIAITPTTRLKDIKAIWPGVEQVQREFVNGKRNNQPVRNTERDLRILELSEEGKHHREIWKIINQEYPNKTVTEYSDISKIIIRMRKRIGDIT